MNLRTEKAIKAWLALPKEVRRIEIIDRFSGSPSVQLLEWCPPEVDGRAVPDIILSNIIASFTIASIVAKRYPKRKKVKK